MKYFLLISLLVSTLFSAALATDVKFVGKSLLEVTFFKIDVYEISYYKNESGVSEIHLDYKRDVELKHSIMGWNQGLEHILEKSPVKKEKLKWIIKNTTDYKEKDLVVLRRDNNKVSLFKNKKLVAQIEDADIASIIHEAWIGSKPISKEMKNDLLGIK